MRFQAATLVIFAAILSACMAFVRPGWAGEIEMVLDSNPTGAQVRARREGDRPGTAHAYAIQRATFRPAPRCGERSLGHARVHVYGAWL